MTRFPAIPGLPDLAVRPRLRSARRRIRIVLRRNDRVTLLLIFFVYLPTGILGVYLLVFFSDMYVSETRFAIRSGDGGEFMSSSLLGSLFQSPGSANADAFIVQEYITTWDMLEKVEEQLHWRAHYADPSKDIYSRLKIDPTREELLDYWQWLVTTTFDMDKGIITVQVKAYTPETARDVNAAVLHFSEELVNRMNDRAHQDAVRLAAEEVASAERRLERARDDTQRFRDDKGILDPKSVAAGLEGVIAKLEGEAAATEAELAAALKVMHETSPTVANIKRKLRSLRDQLTAERSRLAGLSGGALSSLVGDYARLLAEEEFSRQLLMETMASLEKARIRAVAQSRYLVPFQSPTLPQESEYPKVFLFTLGAFFVLLIALGICSLIIAAVRDHMGV
jgi:capsular polysaccharide transport system permease protein